MDTMTLVLRLALALVILPHGARKLLGWFGGSGFRGTMGWFTQTMHIPVLFGLLAIVTEFFGPLALLAGLLTRPSALGIAVVMVVAAVTTHRSNGFFMNWFGAQEGEGFEFRILPASIGLALAMVLCADAKRHHRRRRLVAGRATVEQSVGDADAGAERGDQPPSQREPVTRQRRTRFGLLR
jgi:putative oxidoreductase